MNYYKHLGLQKEPFSGDSDPEFFYPSDGHATALKRLESAIRQRRGLSLIVGDAGTGKTTLSRALLEHFSGDEDFKFCLISNPVYRSEYQFLLHLTRMLNIVPGIQSTLDLKDALRKFLFQEFVGKNKTVVLLIDEGHSMSRENLEVLRMLLDDRADDTRLLQSVILAETEFLGRINNIHQFAGRIALKYALNTLDEFEVRQMIEFRLARAGGGDRQVEFSDGAIRLITQQTQGNPGKVIRLCREAVKALADNKMFIVDKDIVLDVIAQMVKV